MRTPSRRTLGPSVWKSAEVLGKPFFAWQRYVTDIALEIDEETGELAYDDVTILVPRQQGKTEISLPVMAHRCTALGSAQRVLYTAQTGGDARKKWEDVHKKRLEASSYRAIFHTRLRIGQEAFIWANGSFWMPGSVGVKGGGTGDTLDLGVIDEFWARPDDSLDLAMRPAMMTRDHHQIWRLSMVPGLKRMKNHDPKYLRMQMELGRDRVRRGVNRGHAYFEYSAVRTADPGDPATWRSCMPGLKFHGGLISESTIRSDYESLELVDFCAEYLGWLPENNAPKWVVISRSKWSDLQDGLSAPAGGLAMAVEVSPDRLKACIAIAGRRDDGDWHVEIVEPGSEIVLNIQGTDWVLDRLLQLIEVHEPVAVVIDPRSPAASFIVTLRNKGIEVITPSVQECAAAAGRFYDGTGENAEHQEGPRVRHLAQAILDRAVAHARSTESPSSGSFWWQRVGTIDISALIAATLALHGYELKKPDDYDVLSSIPDLFNQCPHCYACEIDGYLNHYPECARPRDV